MKEERKMEKSDLMIRRARVDDASELTQVMKRAYTPYIKQLDGIKLPPLEVDYSEEIKNYPVWVVEHKQQVIAGLIMFFNNEHAYLSNIGIDPAHQGKGIGYKLIDFAEGIAKEKGYAILELATHIKLLENIAYYNKLGYKEVERDENKVYFMKKLDNNESKYSK